MVRRGVITALSVAAAVLWLMFVPLVVIDTFASLLVLAVIVSGAALIVGRTGAVDLSLGAVAGLGAYAGGVSVALLDLPALMSLLFGAVAGAIAGGAVGAVLGRVGRIAGALASLAIGGAIVALLGVWPDGGGAAGFHAVPLLTGAPRSDLAVIVIVLMAALATVRTFAAGRGASKAAVAVASPTVAASLGSGAAASAAVSGAVGGAIVGLGGAALAAASGSVVPAGFALPFTAAIVVAGLVAGAPPWGPPTATLLVWGFPVLVAWLPGEAVGALAGGVIGLIVLAVRHGRPLWPWRSRHLDVAVPDTASTARRGGAGVLEVDLPALSEGRIRFEAQPGEIVVLVGPNGSGKSTLLAQIGGQLPDGGGVRLRGKPLPRGAASRAGAGVARTWQRDPSLPDDDAVVTAVSTEEDRRAMAQAAAIVGGHGADDLLRLAARRPAVALLDEPAASHPPRVVRALLRHLARVGTVVVVAEHEPRTAAIADQVIRLERT